VSRHANWDSALARRWAVPWWSTGGQSQTVKFWMLGALWQPSPKLLIQRGGALGLFNKRLFHAQLQVLPWGATDGGLREGTSLMTGVSTGGPASGLMQCSKSRSG